MPSQQNNQDAFQFPAIPPDTPGLPQNPVFIVWEGFDGLNTKPTRPAIGDQQLFYSNNWMPLGHSNLRTLPDVGPSLYTATPKVIRNFKFGNIGETPISVVFHDDGGVIQVNTLTSGVTTIAPPGTILAPTSSIGFSQWGSQYILFSAAQANGYFIWDGNALYTSGTLGPQIRIDDGGLGYTSAPRTRIVRSLGVDTTAQTSASIVAGSVVKVAVLNASSSYTSVGEAIVAFSGGNGSIGTTAIGTATVAGGAVTSVTVQSANQGAGYTSTTIVELLGGGGAGATATVTAISGVGVAGAGGIYAVTIGTGGHGYSLPPTVSFVDPNNAVAVATATVMPFGIDGTAIETFTSRVWLANGNDTKAPIKSRIAYSSPGDPANFNTNDGAGAQTSNDSFLRVGYYALRQSNGFLYLGGDSSFNYISGVQTSGDPAVTTFGNSNVDPQIGTPWGESLQVFSRSIVFANPFGVHALAGGAAEKVSEQLDGIYATVSLDDFTIVPSSAVADIYGIRCYVLLYPIVDNFSGQTRNALLLWDGKRWFTASQTPTINKIAGQEINSVLTAWGTDGASLYPMFTMPSDTLPKIAQSKLWDKPTYMMTKLTNRLFGMARSNDQSDADLSITVDTEAASSAVITPVLETIVWQNNANQITQWQNNSFAIVDWATSAGLQVFVAPVSISGSLLGLTVQTSAADVTLISLTLLAQQYKLNN